MYLVASSTSGILAVKARRVSFFLAGQVALFLFFLFFCCFMLGRPPSHTGLLQTCPSTHIDFCSRDTGYFRTTFVVFTKRPLRTFYELNSSIKTVLHKRLHAVLTLRWGVLFTYDFLFVYMYFIMIFNYCHESTAIQALKYLCCH